MGRRSGSRTSADDERDTRLAAVFDQIMSDAARRTADQTLAGAIAEHPDLAQDLRELWATAMIASDVAMFHSVDADQDGHGPLHIASGDPGSTSPQAPGRPGGPEGISGTRIGDYQLETELGRGGMGVVYRARQLSLERTVALKMIPNAAFASPEDLARLRAEALAAARLSHPNIVPVYEVGEHNGHPWFSMQYIEGVTLSARLTSGPLPLREAVTLLLPIIEAIGAAHRAGVLHRDLKPSNILISAEGVPFVTDFGLAKRVRVADDTAVSERHLTETASLTQTGSVIGTPSWMSPEQAAGQTESIDVATDVYSLGAVLYAALTGRPPFQAASALETLRMVMEQDPPAIRLLNPAVDWDLEMVVMKCLQKPRDLRYASAAALAADLRSWLLGEPVSARRSAFAQVMARLFRESHQASILQNWGLLWMWHSLVLLILCGITNVVQLYQIRDRWPYVSLWVVGLGLWAAIFWNVRHRAGPVTAVERQIAHLWGGSMIASSMLFAVESILNRPVLEFSPVLGVIAGSVFLVKAGMLSGRFYVQAMALFLTSLVMAVMQRISERTGGPNFSISLFGIVSALTFFLPGLKYYRQQRGGRHTGRR